MSSAQSYADIKALPKQTPKRREAVRSFLRRHRGITRAAAALASVDPSMVSKVLHGAAVSAPVENAIEQLEATHEERQ